MKTFLKSLLCLLVAALPSSAQVRYGAPVGYIVTVESRDGKPLKNGLKVHIALVTQDEEAAKKQYTELATVHAYVVRKKELGTQAEFDEAVRSIKEQIAAGEKRGEAPANGPKPAGGAVAGSTFELDGRMFTFNSNGRVTTQYNTGGEWKQDRNEISWNIADGPFVWNYDAKISESGEMMTVYRSSYNPNTGNSGSRTLVGTARRTTR